MTSEKSLSLCVVYKSYVFNFLVLYFIYVFPPFFLLFPMRSKYHTRTFGYPVYGTEGVHHCTVSPDSRRPGNVKLNSTTDPVLYPSTKADFPLGHRLQDGVTDWVRAGPGVRRPRGAHPARLSVYRGCAGLRPPPRGLHLTLLLPKISFHYNKECKFPLGA